MIDLVKSAKDALIARRQPREKTSFWASDCEKSAFDLYHSWIGTPPTNPPDASTLRRFLQGEEVEERYVKLWRDLGLVKHGLEDQEYMRFKYKGIEISGKIDVTLQDEMPVEVKSFFGYAHEAQLKNGEPKASYLKQLATYMYYKKARKGILFMAPIEPHHPEYQFVLTQTAQGQFECNQIKFNLLEEFDRFVDIYTNYIFLKIEPKSEFVYKYPLDQIDFSTLSSALISAMRNNKKVHGDWQVVYSDYKDLIITREGSELGYSLEELEFIKEATKGYSSKVKS